MEKIINLDVFTCHNKEIVTIVKKCRWCGNKFKVSGDFADGMKYCCDDCYELGRIRQIKREFAGLNKGRK